MNLVLGVDIGGSHITAAVVDLDTRNILSETIERRLVDSAASASDIIDQWSGVISSVIKKSEVKIKHVGIAMPGPFDYKEGISYIKAQGKYDSLCGLNVGELLARSLKVLPEVIAFENDASCFLKGELLCRSHQNIPRAIGLTVGTGLGSAILDSGTVLDADLWNTPFKAGIAEDYLSTRWFLKKYSEMTGKTVANVKELSEMAKTDTAIKRIFDEFGENLAGFIKAILKNQEVDLVIIGGNIAKSYALFSSKLLKLRTNIKQSVLGESSNILGAASCCFQSFPSAKISK